MCTLLNIGVNVMRRSFLLLLALTFFPLSAQAWWNEGWAYRKEMVLDVSPTGADISENLQNVPVLIRLHTGNFGYFLDIQPKGEDIRFVAGDDETPLKFHIEHFDAINEMALIWVQIPEIRAGSQDTTIWMYYGSESAVAGEDENGTYDAQTALVYHFDADKTAPVDSTAYANKVGAFNAKLKSASLIGGGVSFAGINDSGATSFVISDAPTLAADTTQGWTWSAWVKIDEPSDAILFERTGTTGSLVLGLDGTAPYVRLVNGSTLETPKSAQLVVGNWHHIAVTLTADGMTLNIDGNQAAFADGVMPASLDGDIVIGNSVAGSNPFIGQMDELNIHGTNRSSAWFSGVVASQGTTSNIVIYGEDSSQESSSGGHTHFEYVMTKLTFDAKVVIVFLIIMSVVSWVIMVMKFFYLRRVTRDNKRFLEAYYALGTDDPAQLDVDDTEQDKELEGAPVAQALFGDHSHYQSSPLFHMYHKGIQETKARVGATVGAQAAGISEQSADAIRAVLDADMVRESQKINSRMVLLTIAISGGPFIGLLGTVIGVMITFAEMAATGDVSIASIAPGMAAALMATIVGLWVAIPALFGYNYLGAIIKEISADMRVFVDEFVTRVAEYYGN